MTLSDEYQVSLYLEGIYKQAYDIIYSRCREGVIDYLGELEFDLSDDEYNEYLIEGIMESFFSAMQAPLIKHTLELGYTEEWVMSNLGRVLDEMFDEVGQEGMTKLIVQSFTTYSIRNLDIIREVLYNEHVAREFNWTQSTTEAVLSEESDNV